MIGQQRLQDMGRTDQHNLKVLDKRKGRQDPMDRRLRRAIAAHGVNRHSHHRRCHPLSALTCYCMGTVVRTRPSRRSRMS